MLHLATMPIRQRLHKNFRPLAYHRKFGSLAVPPLTVLGTTPRDGGWPPGTMLTHSKVAGRKGRSVVVGWAVKRDFQRYRSIGVWIASKVTYSLGNHRGRPLVRKDGSQLLVGDFLGYADGFDPSKDFIYVGEHEDRDDAFDAMREAWTDTHGITLP